MGAFGVFECIHCAALVDDGADHKCSRRDLIEEVERLRALLLRTLPHIQGNTDEWEEMAGNLNLRSEARRAANQRVTEGNALLAECVAALRGEGVE